MSTLQVPTTYIRDRRVSCIMRVEMKVPVVEPSTETTENRQQEWWYY